MAPLPAEQKLKAKALILAGKGPDEVSKTLGIRCDVIRQWKFRHKWGEQANAVAEVVSATMSQKVTEALIDQGRVVRDALSRSVSKQVEVLAKTRVRSVNQLANTPKRQGLAAVTKTLVEIASAVYGWNDDDNGSLRDLGTLRQAIDVETIVDQPVNNPTAPLQVVSSEGPSSPTEPAQ